MHFNCSCCGECCRGEMRVYLNPDDLILMASFLGFDNTRRLFEENYIVIGTDKNGAPVPRIRFSRGPAESCPFLENRLSEDVDSYRLDGICRLHPDSKPLVCMLAPLSREVDLDACNESWGITEPLPGCPGFSELTDVGSFPVPRAPEGLKTRLDRERSFYAELSSMLDSDRDSRLISESLYHLETDCIRLDELV